MNRYWFLNFLKHLSICYDLLKFPCLVPVVKTGFKFYYLLSPPQANFPIWNWHPASIYLWGAKPVYAESLSERIKIIFRAFSSQCWAPRRYLYFLGHTSICGVPSLQLIPTFGAFFVIRGAKQPENWKNWFYIDRLKFQKIITHHRAL